MLRGIMVKKSARYLSAALLFGAISAAPAAASVYDYTVSGSYTTHTFDRAISGLITTSGNSVSSMDITTPGFGSFANILNQYSVAGDYIIVSENENDTYKFTLVLDTSTSLFSGQTTTIDGGSGFLAVGTSGPTLGQPFSGTLTIAAAVPELTIAAAVPEPSTWAMMILGFCSLGFMAYRRKMKPSLMTA